MSTHAQQPASPQVTSAVGTPCPPRPATTPAGGHTGPSATEIAAQARARRAARAARSPEGIEAELAARRAHLTADLTALGARLAPQSLKAQATASAREAVAQARAGMASALAASRPTTCAQAGAAGAAGDDEGSGCCAPAPSVLDRVHRLFDDARDGEPTSLGIVTGAALVLAGVSVLAVVKALRR
ncbi:DUF3618 domain-containing protein [Actinomyces sp. W5033]|uniref:DUF3618 domain-containing protein n=1 Tax=Actinomyces sp. W5033 TaxID=3446479 RepID=UPI003EE1F51F